MLLFLISGSGLSAQISKGSFLIGELTTLNLEAQVVSYMNLGYATYKTKSDNNTDNNSDKIFSINLTPRVGYFVIDNLAIGLDIPVNFSHRKDGSGYYKSVVTMLSVGPFVRYYLPGSKVKPFAELNGSLGTIISKSDFDSNENRSTTSLKEFGGGLGAAFPLGKKVCFDVLAGYYCQIIKDIENNSDNDRVRIGTLGLKLGFTVFLSHITNEER